MSSTPKATSTPKRRRPARSPYASNVGSTTKSGSGGFFTPQRPRSLGFPTSSTSTPSALLAGIGGNLHLNDGPPRATTAMTGITTASNSPLPPRSRPPSACRELSTPMTSRRLSRTPSASTSSSDPTSTWSSTSQDRDNKVLNCPGDRFIAHRPSINFDLCNHMLVRGDNAENEPQAGSDAPPPLHREFHQAMKNTLLSPMMAMRGTDFMCKATNGGARGKTMPPRLLSFSERPPPQEERFTNVLKVLHTMSNTTIARASVSRTISSTPLRILDAPDIVDDYYLNLISWGHNNVLAVALGQAVYLWNASTGSIEHLLTLEEQNNFVTSVEWMGQEGGNFLAVGTNHSDIQLWDASRLKQVRTMAGHSARVGTLAWKRHILSSGSRDSSILQHDVRMARHKIATFAGHEQEVCGLKWSPDGSTLASGGNENFLCLWDANMTARGGGSSRPASSSAPYRPRRTLVEHQAAVKALAWCPFQRHLLASGGGTADRSIKFWNTANGSMLNSIDTGSQVCSLQWSRHTKEIVSSHGFSENQLSLWKYPSMLKVKEFRGHTSRVLHMDISPDGCTIVSAAADETLRFWGMFGPPPNSK
ncbi:unnamed protein product, partial [Ascophyllum nodosum]